MTCSLTIASLLTMLVFVGSATAAPLVWSAPVQISEGPLTGVSCPSAQLCVAVGSGTVVTLTNPASGTGLVQRTQLLQAGIEGISCPSTNLCVGVGQNPVKGGGKNVYTSTNPTGGASAWTTTTVEGGNLGPALTAVSCPATAFCAAAGGAEILTSTNPGEHLWSELVVVGQGRRSALSCPSSLLCVAADAEGDITTSTNPTGGKEAWLTAHKEQAAFAGVSCPSNSLCVGVGHNPVIGGGKDVYASTNPTGGASAWSDTRVEGGNAGAGLSAVSCPSEGFCAAVGGGEALTSANPTGGREAWSGPWEVDTHSLTGVSCPSASLCVAVDNAGNVLVGTPATEALELKRWVVSGSLHIKKLNQAIPLPQGSMFNGEAGINLLTGSGPLTGTFTIPSFEATIKILGTPAKVGLELTQVGTIGGSIEKSKTVEGDITLSVPTKANVGFTTIGILGLTVPTKCQSTEPLQLNLVDDLTVTELLTTGSHFTGTTAFPSVKCEGSNGTLESAVLTSLFSGPSNPYSIAIAPPA